jgi:CheY-like chemotaxis protein
MTSFLVVDDNPENRFMLRQLLEQEGCRVRGGWERGGGGRFVSGGAAGFDLDGFADAGDGRFRYRPGRWLREDALRHLRHGLRPVCRPGLEVHALDYLLKPFDSLRFQESLQRVRRRLGEHGRDQLNEQIRQLASRFSLEPRYLQRLAVRIEDRTLLLNVPEVDWLEAAGNYVCVHAGKQSHIVRDSLTHLESSLDPASFARIHRSTLVNLNRIRELRPYWHGDYRIILHSGQTLPLSRRYREALAERLGIQGTLS